MSAGGREGFRRWLARAGEDLARFRRTVPDDVASRLDFSPGSLAVLEGWVLGRFPDFESTMEGSAADVLGMAARYVGETLRGAFGGEWTIEYADGRKTLRDRPVLTGLRGSRETLCPLTLLVEAVERRRGNVLLSACERLGAPSGGGFAEENGREGSG